VRVHVLVHVPHGAAGVIHALRCFKVVVSAHVVDKALHTQLLTPVQIDYTWFVTFPVEAPVLFAFRCTFCVGSIRHCLTINIAGTKSHIPRRLSVIWFTPTLCCLGVDVCLVEQLHATRASCHGEQWCMHRSTKRKPEACGDTGSWKRTTIGKGLLVNYSRFMLR
jgi:hypothetical protein